MKSFFFALLSALSFGTITEAATYRDRSVSMRVVPVDLERYFGKWYEIARFPNFFERDCVGVTAEYSRRDDGKVRVVNTCRKNTLDGLVDRIEGQASVVAPGKLSVTFVPWLPFAKGDYWVLYLDAGYTVAVVGEPKGKTGWILARDAAIGAAQLTESKAALEKNGYDTSKLLMVLQK
ncbi:MAG: lipocalin family protein [Rhodobacterales bacterium]